VKDWAELEKSKREFEAYRSE